MSLPKINGLEIVSCIAQGACGMVFLAKNTPDSPSLFDEDYPWLAVRVFDSLAINRSLIENAIEHLQATGYPKELLPVIWKDSQQGSHCLIMPFIGEVSQDLTPSPSTLKSTDLTNLSLDERWQLIWRIATSIAAMHHRGVPHGNIKPSNIFLGEENTVFLSDYALGNMPGVSLLPYTDAFLYASPEHLLDSHCYVTGRGYASDTYSFGTLAYQLLTGKYPRCHEIFQELEGLDSYEIQVDTNKLFEGLNNQPDITWDTPAQNPQEEKRRNLINQCLALSPKERICDLGEFLHSWEKLDDTQRVENERKDLLSRLQSSRAKTRILLALLCIFILSTGFFLFLFLSEKYRHYADQKSWQARKEQLIDAKKQAQVSEKNAFFEKERSEKREKALRTEADAMRQDLESQITAIARANDTLIAWVTKRENKELPDLTPPVSALKDVENTLEALLEKTKGNLPLQDTQARAALGLAELSLAYHDPQKSDVLLDQALSLANKSAGLTEDFQERVARCRLSILLQSLEQRQSDILIQSVLAKARLEMAPLSSPKNPSQLLQIQAVIEIVEARLAEPKSPENALTHYQKALTYLEGLHDALPDLLTPKSDLARYALHAAKIADTLGKLPTLSALRALAAKNLTSLLNKDPNLQSAKLQLASLRLIAAEEALRTGRDKEGITLLSHAQKLLHKLPANDLSPDGTAMQIALSKALHSIILRDAGKTGKAAEQLDEAIALTSQIVEKNPEALEPLYYLGLFEWFSSGIASDVGDSNRELIHGEKAAAIMQKLLKKGEKKRAVELHRSLAYLYGELGHSCQSRGKKELSDAFFGKASMMWKKLITLDGKKREYTEGLHWSKSRMH